MNERQEETIYREGYRRGKAERHKILDDGTLVVTISDATKVTRVLVEDSEKHGDLYYADRPKGEWIDRSGGIEGAWNYCSVCGEQAIDLYDFCPHCGADMRKREGE